MTTQPTPAPSSRNATTADWAGLEGAYLKAVKEAIPNATPAELQAGWNKLRQQITQAYAQRGSMVKTATQGTLDDLRNQLETTGRLSIGGGSSPATARVPILQWSVLGNAKTDMGLKTAALPEAFAPEGKLLDQAIKNAADQGYLTPDEATYLADNKHDFIANWEQDPNGYHAGTSFGDYLNSRIFGAQNGGASYLEHVYALGQLTPTQRRAELEQQALADRTDAIHQALGAAYANADAKYKAAIDKLIAAKLGELQQQQNAGSLKGDISQGLQGIINVLPSARDVYSQSLANDATAQAQYLRGLLAKAGIISPTDSAVQTKFIDGLINDVVKQTQSQSQIAQAQGQQFNFLDALERNAQNVPYGWDSQQAPLLEKQAQDAQTAQLDAQPQNAFLKAVQSQGGSPQGPDQQNPTNLGSLTAQSQGPAAADQQNPTSLAGLQQDAGPSTPSPFLSTAGGPPAPPYPGNVPSGNALQAQRLTSGNTFLDQFLGHPEAQYGGTDANVNDAFTTYLRQQGPSLAQEFQGWAKQNAVDYFNKNPDTYNKDYGAATGGMSNIGEAINSRVNDPGYFNLFAQSKLPFLKDQFSKTVLPGLQSQIDQQSRQNAFLKAATPKPDAGPAPSRAVFAPTPTLR